MLQTLRNAFKVKDIRKKIYFTFLMMIVVRLGSQLPVPGVDRDFLQAGLLSRPVMHLTFLMLLPAARLKECQYSH